jgi:hypothetical protein
MDTAVLHRLVANEYLVHCFETAILRLRHQVEDKDSGRKAADAKNNIQSEFYQADERWDNKRDYEVPNPVRRCRYRYRLRSHAEREDFGANDPCHRSPRTSKDCCE